ncbi:MAG: cupin [Acidobacteria bacterium]|nr:MAG: cupin [Acidobacteriota bacterium]REK11090.1 MAG: cupin [Acidobacteriota bacterium]
MQLNDDFTKAVLLHTEELEWSPSPMPGVSRRLLDRIGDEVARATSVVRYAPASSFSQHTHHGGEEFLVLDGVFQDEHGDFPAGSYVRNPPGSSHTPGSGPGCVIFVKLWQFDPDDEATVRLDVETALGAAPEEDGVRSAVLHRDERELVRAERWAPGAVARLGADGGLELLVLEGDGTIARAGGGAGAENDPDGSDDTVAGLVGAQLRRRSWLRLPAGAEVELRAGETGCTLWTKRGHLPPPDAG